MNAEERAREVKAATSSDWSRRAGGHKLDKVKGEQKLTVTREPEFLYDKDGNVVGVDAWVQLFDANGRELKIDPHRRIINPPTAPRSGVVEEETGEVDQLGNPVRRRIVTPDPTAAFYEAVWDSVIGMPNPKGWRTRGTVTTIFADTSDGTISSFSSDYSTARSGSGGLFVESNIQAGQLFPEYSLYEGFMSFDTSTIPDASIVSSVELALWLSNDQSDVDFTIEARTFDWGASLTTDDWIPGANLSGLTLLASLATSGIGAVEEYKIFTSEAAFNTATNMKTGIVYVTISSSRTRLNIAPTSTPERCVFRAADTSGTTQDPKITITHALPPAAPSFFGSPPNRIWRLY